MISRDNWNTGDDDLVPIIQVTLSMPDNVWTWRALRGALLLLCDRANWNEVGTASPDLAEQTFIDVYASIDFTP